jgi:hypothetical protein
LQTRRRRNGRPGCYLVTRAVIAPDFPQQLFTGEVPEGIIDSFKPVDVHQQHSALLPLFLRLCDHPRQLLGKAMTIEEPSQIIVVRSLVQYRLFCLRSLISIICTMQ